MKRSAIFFGSLLFLLGIVLLAINLGFVDHRVWRYFWPLVIILLGVWFIFGSKIVKDTFESVTRSIPMSGDTEAKIEFNYGAGQLSIGPSTTPQELLGGTFVGGVTEELNRTGSITTLEISVPSGNMFPEHWVAGNKGINWDVRLTKEIPLKLEFNMGACEAKLDLRELKVTELEIQTGASSTEVQMPQNAGFTKVEVQSGAAKVKFNVPQGVAVSFSESSGLSGIDVDTARFPKNGHVYQSPDYDTAANKAQISYEGGVGSIEIK